MWTDHIMKNTVPVDICHLRLHHHILIHAMQCNTSVCKPHYGMM